MKEKIVIAVIGCGRFAKNFVPLFKAHPEVKKVYVCDLIPERAKTYSENFGVDIIGSFEEALASSEINSIAIFTQRTKHGPMAIASLKAGKHVYSAVPCATDIEDIRKSQDSLRKQDSRIQWVKPDFTERQLFSAARNMLRELSVNLHTVRRIIITI